MKRINTNKKLIISIVVIIILIIISVFGYNVYQQQQLQRKIDNSITQIKKIEKDFTTKDNREEKLTLLKTLLKEHEEYKKSKDMIDEVDKEYHNVIATIRKAFKEEYNKTLSENTLKDVEKISDKEQLTNAKSKLSDLLKIVQDEKDIICLENDVKEYETSINELIKSYDERLTTIAQKEQQAEEERKAQEDANSQKPSYNNGNHPNNSNNSGGNVNSSNSESNITPPSKPNLPWYYGMEKVWWENENGRFEGYRDGYGNLYDMNGNNVSW